MTTHIKNRIEKILFNGGIVSLELKKLVDILEDIRSTKSINTEFKEAFIDIEKRKGTITKSTKDQVFEYINNTDKFKLWID
tara:strand:- start:657 stop:899 length:243 start_codon:yes stop_codon:yes gene_type:complete